MGTEAEMKTTLRAALAALLCLAAVGCSRPVSPLVGTWKGSMEGPNGQTGTITMTFKEDGTMKSAFKSGARTMEVNGTYTANDGLMTQTLTSIVSDGKATTPKEETKRDLKYLVNGNELLIGTSNDQKSTLTRVE
jgi:hypothetical protein